VGGSEDGVALQHTVDVGKLRRWPKRVESGGVVLTERGRTAAQRLQTQRARWWTPVGEQSNGTEV
jgi:IS4 transposase